MDRILLFGDNVNIKHSLNSQTDKKKKRITNTDQKKKNKFIFNRYSLAFEISGTLTIEPGRALILLPLADGIDEIAGDADVDVDGSIPIPVEQALDDELFNTGVSTPDAIDAHAAVAIAVGIG